MSRSNPPAKAFIANENDKIAQALPGKSLGPQEAALEFGAADRALIIRGVTGRMHFGIVAGEKSGDILGAGLMRALCDLYPAAQFSGIGGPEMKQLGCHSLAPMERLSVMGLVEPLGRLPELLRIKRRLERFFFNTRPAAFIGIDAPDFNLRLAANLHKDGIRTIHYVSPSVWAWRRGRIRGIARSVDLMLTLFPFETEIYRERGVRVQCVGHPLADAIDFDDGGEKVPQPESGMGHPSNQSQSGMGHPSIDSFGLDGHGVEARRQLAIDPSAPVVALLPGSREGEIRRMAPVFLAAAAAARQKFSELRFLLPCTDTGNRKLIAHIIAEGDFADANCELLDDSRSAMAAADFVVLASGTASLEAMLLRRPMVVCYKLAPLSYALASRIVEVDHMAIPNLLAGERIVPEYVQNEVNKENLLHEIEQFMMNRAPREELIKKFKKQHRILRRNASVQAANAIHELLTQ